MTQDLTHAEIAVTFAIERADGTWYPVTCRRLPENTFEHADTVAYCQWFSTLYEIDDEQGLWMARIPWRLLGIAMLHAQPWTMEHPAPERGENGPGMKLPSGIWVLLADTDIVEAYLIDDRPDEEAQ